MGAVLYVVVHLLIVLALFRDARRRRYSTWLALSLLALVPSPLNLLVYLVGIGWVDQRTRLLIEEPKHAGLLERENNPRG